MRNRKLGAPNGTSASTSQETFSREVRRRNIEEPNSPHNNLHLYKWHHTLPEVAEEAAAALEATEAADEAVDAVVLQEEAAEVCE